MVYKDWILIMELQHLIRCKMLSLELTHDLLHIARGNNIIEDLIDYIKVNLAGLSDDIEEFDYLKGRVLELEKESEWDSDRIEKLEEKISDNELRANSLKDFIEKTQENYGRYPSIDEVWEASWNACRERI